MTAVNENAIIMPSVQDIHYFAVPHIFFIDFAYIEILFCANLKIC